MKELELLGLQPDGEQLTLNDSEGNRYVLPITDALRAALRGVAGVMAARHVPATSEETS